ncbi:hypothetical protein pEaSNUABM37_00221 [Erwinia phage pEa_SNUABM_37]|nr:hypothetical protein pEaSNUABM37_00221 [Erwinia phage pEa_SNUABM_37]QXO10691.1 hypothetical protein pEaSNUABM48_00221 [Erwinia phage pEa_SNUABM_48]
MSTEMTVTRAIATQKSLTKQIVEANKLLVLCVPTRGEEAYREVQANGKVSVEDATNQIKAAWQRLSDITTVRDDIRAKLVKSNAETTIKVGDVSMTIVAALDFRNSLPERKALLDRMKANWNSTNAAYTQSFNQHEAELTRTRNEALNTNKKVDADFEKNFIAPINLRSRPDILDPMNIKGLIAALEKEISDFELNIDYALSESNAITKITIEAKGVI